MKLAPLIICALVVAIALVAGPAASQKARYSYVGMQECAKCHGTDALGNQVRAWQNTPHARAARILRTERAAAIAEKTGVKNPSEDTACLKCHTTGGGALEPLKAEGVGCEACHGPASEYVEISNHAPYGDKEKDYQRAQSFGMYRTLGIEGIKLRERMCKRCHTMDRPCVPDDVEDRKRQELALSVIADFVFRHPLRRK